MVEYENGYVKLWDTQGCRQCGTTTAKPYIRVGRVCVICAPCWQHMKLGERLSFMREYLNGLPEQFAGEIKHEDWKWWADAIWQDYLNPVERRR